MPKYYKRGALGRMIEAEGGSSDPDLAEVRMTEEEYRGLWDRIRRSEKAAEAAKAEAKKQTDEAWSQANQELVAAKLEAEAKAQRRINIAQQSAAASAEEASSLQERLAQAEADLQNEKNLHGNMMRIMKERANAQRGIRPKKEHDGFIAMDCRQQTVRYSVDVWQAPQYKTQYTRDEALSMGLIRIDNRSTDVWKMTVQTPYSAGLPYSAVQELVETGMAGFLADIGVRYRSKKSGKYRLFRDEEGSPVNGLCLYRWEYKANYRTCLWELDLWLTEAPVVPAERMPPQKNQRKE